MKDKKELSPEEKKTISSTFVLIFPALMIGILGIVFVPAQLWWISLIVILLEIYHFIMIKRFVEGHYRFH